MNSSSPFLPPISNNYCNLAGTSTAAAAVAGDVFSNPMINSGFPLQMPPPPNPIPPDSLFITGGAASSEAKSLAASETHREAERLRRKRINGHLATLRTLLPNLLKTDKASLLTEAVRRMKELKEETSDLLTPSDADEKLLPEDIDSVRVRRCDVNVGILVATLSCEDRPDLLTDLSRALKTVKAKVVKAEIATIGGRTKIVLRLQDGGGREGMGALSRALRVVIDRPACTGYGSSFGLFGPKRQRLNR
ncbi:hypothetical protein V2J09_021736 [Rumex salicifolius]